jgi:hypothetical protein
MSKHIYHPSRLAALEQHQVTFEGEPCKHGHTTRYTKRPKACVLCHRKVKRTANEKPEVKARQKAYNQNYLSDPHKKRRMAEYMRAYKYGITPGQLESIWRKQHGSCAICIRAIDLTNLCVDHDHATGEVRGLLCRGCNIMIGLAHDNPIFLNNAITYLKAR